MHLTNVLCFFVRRRHVPGALFSGKHRVVPRITLRMKKRAVAQLIMEQRNMDVLSRSYLTQAEEYRHMADSGRYQERIERLQDDYKTKKMFKSRFMDDYFEHLNMSKKWE